jgi:hypothetical protein
MKLASNYDVVHPLRVAADDLCPFFARKPRQNFIEHVMRFREGAAG